MPPFDTLIVFLTSPTAKLVAGSLTAYWAFAALVDAMPKPTSTTNPWLVFAYKAVQGFAGNLKRATRALHIPGADATDGVSQ